MSSLVAVNILRLSYEFWFDFNVVKSWWEHMNFVSLDEANTFFVKNQSMIKAQPFVKWVWWKRQIMPQLQKLFPLEFNNYHEPFLWGWAVFFNLQKKQSFLSDVNAELINTYQVIKDKPKELIKFLETCKHSKEFFLEIRSWDRLENWTQNYTEIQRAWRFIYLNRTCFNWLYRVNSKWQFNVPMWSYANPDFVQKENILNVSKLLKKTKAIIKLQGFDNVLKTAKAWDLVYFDPPYDTLSETASFTSYNESGFGKNMQESLRDVCEKLDKMWVKFMMSNHNTPFIRELYKNFRIEIVKARRNVNSKGTWRGEVEEVVVMNY